MPKLDLVLILNNSFVISIIFTHVLRIHFCWIWTSQKLKGYFATLSKSKIKLTTKLPLEDLDSWAFLGHHLMSFALHPSFSDLWRPSPALSSTPNYFWLPLLFHLPRALWIWVGVFYPQVYFTLHSFPTFLSQPAFRKASLGAGSYSLKNAGLHTDPRNTDPAHLFIWFTVIHNHLYILNLHLFMSILQKFYLWWKLW